MYQDLNKRERISKYREDIKDVPTQYKVNELKEELVIRYASERYNKQYTNLFPTNPELLLSPMNEFGQRKFVSTFITPTLLPHDELYHFKDCAAFVSDHVTFEPITKNYSKIPDIISSPTMTLKTQKGDCFDISILLASLLIGAGYNAYCVCGFAKKELCINNTKLITIDIGKYLYSEEKKQDENVEKVEGKYKVKKKAKLESKYMKRLQQIKNDSKNNGNDNNNNNNTKSEDRKRNPNKKKREESDEEDDGKNEERMFCWVVVLPSSRGIETPVYVNPSNGEVSPVTDPRYLRALTVWNHDNYWVNMHDEHTNYDLKKDNWECIFLGVENEFPEDPNWDEDEDEVLDLPLSFCFPLEISKERFQTRFPNSTKVVEYKNVRVRRSAPFFEKDLSVLEVHFYDTDSNPKKILRRHVLYQKRKDKLQERIEYFRNDDGRKKVKTEENYAPGRKYSSTRMEGLKKIIITYGVLEEYHFYPGARLDGLSMIRKIKYPETSVENPEFSKKVIFTFCDREDFLWYRSATYEVDDDTRSGGGGSAAAAAVSVRVVKKSEKFERNPGKSTDVDVEKLEYYPTRLRVIYHFGESRITQSSKVFTREGEVQVNLVDHYSVKPTREETLKECNELFKMDKRCTDEVSRVLEELKEILEIRSEEEKKIKFERSIYDYLQTDVDEEEGSGKAKKSSVPSGGEGGETQAQIAESTRRKRNDLLSLYIPESGIKDKEEAIRIFEQIMERTKNRLSNRAQIIQDRLKTEKSIMNKKRLQIQKQDNENAKKEDQFLKFWEETIFKTKILQERCDKNIKESEDYYLKTQMSLLNDNRLKEFFKDEVDIQLKDYKDVV